MPVKRKRSTKRKTATVGAMKKTRKFNGKVYTRSTCSRTKTDAKKTAASARAKGKKARVVAGKGKYCVYTRG